MTVLAAECAPVAGATCTEQISSMTAADGTVTRTQNFCFSDGTKDLEVDTTPPDASVASRTTRIVRNGALCSTFQFTTTSSVDTAGDTIQTTTETITGPTGDLIATAVLASTRASTGTTVTQTITCAGQQPETFDQNCLYSGIFSCSTGSCM